MYARCNDTDASTVVKNTFIQVRVADDYSHKHDIQAAIDEERGDTKKLKLQVVLLEGYYQENEDEYGIDQFYTESRTITLLEQPMIQNIQRYRNYQSSI